MNQPRAVLGRPGAVTRLEIQSTMLIVLRGQKEGQQLRPTHSTDRNRTISATSGSYSTNVGTSTTGTGILYCTQPRRDLVIPLVYYYYLFILQTSLIRLWQITSVLHTRLPASICDPYAYSVILFHIYSSTHSAPIFARSVINNNEDDKPQARKEAMPMESSDEPL